MASRGDVLTERTPLLSPGTGDNVPQEQLANGSLSTGRSSSRPERYVSDALTRIISATSLDCLVPSDLMNLDSSSHTELSDPEASAEDYAYTLTALLEYRQQQIAQEGATQLDLYGQWTQDNSADSDAKLLERHVDVVWGQFLAVYRTDEEIETVLWMPFRKEEASLTLLKVVDYLEGTKPCLSLLTHPLVEAAVMRRWRAGRYYGPQMTSSLLQRLDVLAGTPRNNHILALLSHFTYLYLLARYLIDPPDRISAGIWVTSQGLHWGYIALLVFAVANALFVRYPFNFLYYMVLVAFVLPFPGHPIPGDGFFDILLLAFAVHIWSFHRPSVISPLLLSDLSRTLPLSGFVHQSIVDGISPSFFYFGPALIASVVLLSLSLEGNYFHIASTFLTSLTSTIPAPMETRNAFLTISLVIIVCLIFSIFATTVAFPNVRSARAPKSNWDAYGGTIGHESRSIAVAACSFYDRPYLYPPPFNLLRIALVLPFELISGRTAEWVKAFNVYLWRVTVLPFLSIAFLLSKVL